MAKEPHRSKHLALEKRLIAIIGSNPYLLSYWDRKQFFRAKLAGKNFGGLFYPCRIAPHLVSFPLRPVIRSLGERRFPNVQKDEGWTRPFKKNRGRKSPRKTHLETRFFCWFQTRLVNNQWFMKHPSEKYARQNGNHLPQFSGGRLKKN